MLRTQQVILLAVGCTSILFATDVLTGHFDNTRDNWNAQEATLTSAAVSGGHFNKLGTWTLDGALFAQPLIATAVTINGAQHNLLIECTMHDSCYGLDADNAGIQFWQVSLGTSRTTYPGQFDSGGLFYGLEVGCLSTPVIDKANGFVYVACTDATPTWTLWQLNLATGATVSSVAIAHAGFDPSQELQRADLALAGGTVYVAFGSYDDTSPWFGWIFGYSASTLAQSSALNLCPTGNGGGIWNGAPAVDGAGNLYVGAGNGTYDGVSNFGESLVKLSPSLSILDWFTPAAFNSLNPIDADLGSGRVMLLPGSSYVLIGAKDFNVYAVDTNAMGHVSGAKQAVLTGGGAVTGDSGIFGGLVSPNGRVYVPNNDGPIYSFTYSGNALNASALTTAASFAAQGVALSGSSNGAQGGIVWAATATISPHTRAEPGTLRALDAATLAELYNSDQIAGDALGNLAKFASPTVANGKVYIPTHDGAVQAYGVLPTLGGSSQRRGAIRMRGSSAVR